MPEMHRERRVRRRSPPDLSPRPIKRRCVSKSPRPRHAEDRHLRDEHRQRRAQRVDAARNPASTKAAASIGHTQRTSRRVQPHKAVSKMVTSPQVRPKGSGATAALPEVGAPITVAASPSPGSSYTPTPEREKEAGPEVAAADTAGLGPASRSGSASAVGTPAAAAAPGQCRREDEVSLSPSSSPSPPRAAAGAAEKRTGAESVTAGATKDSAQEEDGNTGVNAANGVPEGGAGSAAQPAQEVKARMQSLKERLAQKWQQKKA